MINTGNLLKEMYQHERGHKIKSYELERIFDVTGSTIRKCVNDLRRTKHIFQKMRGKSRTIKL